MSAQEIDAAMEYAQKHGYKMRIVVKDKAIIFTKGDK